jgi:carboxyl-terminal processing protease
MMDSKVMNNKIGKTIVFLIAGIILLTGTFSGGVIVGWVLPHSQTASLELSPNSVTENLSQQPDITPQAGQGETLDTLFEPFWRAWNIVHDQYLEQPVDDQQLMQGAISGMLDSLGDPYTSYMSPVEYEEQQSPLNGEYEGIGVWVDTSGDFLTIISPIPNTPAEEAGLKPGDQIIGVDGEDVTGMDGSLVIRRILGPEGSSVQLTIQREGVDPFDIEIKRARITVPSVEGKMLEDDVAYVQIYNFGQNTGQELRSTLKDLNKNDPAGLIIDLRYNGGGYLDTAIQVLSEFIQKGKIVMYEEFGDGSLHELKTSGNGLALDIPLVVLVNEGSASASEITAGAIQDYERGLLVGTTTFGKGLVQNWIPLGENEGAMRVTIARWLTPNKRQIHGSGLEPDFTVEITDEQIQNGQDPQLEKAIEIITSVGQK